ncbi:hypothetical protein [Clostridium cellulovorans]|uniref:Co-chaperone DjlA N-terminal domain-containing protein n=1 Tax=Clostridium cellulovorans (strain ATCC 35296 / DSM 3052 / OCM 3 / 743B) TaxID=573061 RepID=D9SLQ1_CLOC7|nr:hypothetical protein [Clostridium cellulovorans]ADL53688.1 hypothetical protein Clocel_4025 [Clostridium cellulovorans 743B]
MFLNMLNERESKDFLELALIAMNINGIIKESEKAVFQTYKMETGLQDYELVGKDYNQLVTVFQASTKKVKKAIIIELAGVLDADEEVDENERKWIEKLGIDWGFRNTEIRKMVRWVEDFNDLLKEGYEYINNR